MYYNPKSILVVMMSVVLVGNVAVALGADIQGQIKAEESDRSEWPALNVRLLPDGDTDGDPVASVRSDELGEFRFEDVLPGQYRIVVEMPLQIDKGPLVGLAPPTRPQVEVKDDDALISTQVLFREGVSVRGQVVDHRGQPIERATVGTSAGMSNYMVRTDGDGVFVYHGLPPKEAFILTVVEPMRYRDSDHLRYGYARRVEVSPIEDGESADIGKVEFELKAKGQIRGEYLDWDGQRLSGTRVLKVLSDDGSILDGIMSMEGQISGEVPSGKYRILYNDKVVEESSFEVIEGGVTEIKFKKPEDDG